MRLVRVDAGRPGLRVVLMPDAPFAPEIPHAQVELDGVAVEDGDVLEGDGYDAYLKPFRTVEDIHVHAALLGYLIGAARRHEWPDSLVERLSALVVSARSLAAAPPSAPEIHIAVAGMLEETRRVVDDSASLWESAGTEERDRWGRDRVLLEVAGKARAARRERAWEALLDRPAPDAPSSPGNRLGVAL